MSTNLVSLLNDLVETSKDGQLGFEKAAQDAHDPQMKTLFQNRAASCARAVVELQAQVKQLGGDPESGGSTSGALHRGWVNLKSAITDRSEHDILVECERGEDAAKKRYHDALEKTDIPAAIRTLIENQYQGVLQNHDKIRDLRDQFAKK